MKLEDIRAERELWLQGHPSQWGDLHFHVENKQIVGKANVLPLNALLAQKHPGIKRKYIARAGGQRDPYGIFSKGERIEIDGVYIGSQKFSRSFLMNITSQCHGKCFGCYKGEYTLEEEPFFTQLTYVNIQTEKLVEYLNGNPEIASVIMSGGEPLLLDNKGLEDVLEKLKAAQHLLEFRICTGTIFQGSPFRIDQKLVDLLKEYSESSNVRIHINAHLNHPAQFTPEAIVAIKIVREGEIPINSQVPLQEGVNVFREDYDKTIKTLSELAELQSRHGIRPYKYILHMDSGSLDYSVPLEFMLQVLGDLKYRTDHPLPETWQPVSVSILCQDGNILLSPQLLLCMKKEICEDYVKYQIPVPENKTFRYVTYKEPLMKGFNDNPSSLEYIISPFH